MSLFAYEDLRQGEVAVIARLLSTPDYEADSPQLQWMLSSAR